MKKEPLGRRITDDEVRTAIYWHNLLVDHAKEGELRNAPVPVSPEFLHDLADFLLGLVKP